MNASATIETTGELIELPAETTEDIVTSYRLVNETIEAYEKVKKQLQKAAAERIDAEGAPLEHGGFMLRSYTTQRMTYDKAVLREVFDEDTLDLFLDPAKGRIDKYIKEHLDDLGDASTRLRETMLPMGKPFSVVRLERLDRSES